ncbi:MAG: rhodanese-like domain-containing protein [Gammaproteobacteria bacterium]
MERLIEFVANNLFWVSLWVAILSLLLWNLFGDMIMGINQLEPGELTRRINHEHAVVIDVRSAEDYQAGHIMDAVNIPEGELQNRKKEIEKYRKKPVVVYCQNGTTSNRAVRLLKADGFPDVSGLKGGLMSWQKAGMPLSRGKS